MTYMAGLGSLIERGDQFVFSILQGKGEDFKGDALFIFSKLPTLRIIAQHLEKVHL